MSFWYIVLAIVLAIVIYQVGTHIIVFVILLARLQWSRFTYWYKHGKLHRNGRKNLKEPPRVRVNLFLSKFWRKRI